MGISSEGCKELSGVTEKCSISWLWWWLYRCIAFVKHYWTICLKWGHFIRGKLYLNKVYQTKAYLFTSTVAFELAAKILSFISSVLTPLPSVRTSRFQMIYSRWPSWDWGVMENRSGFAGDRAPLKEMSSELLASQPHFAIEATLLWGVPIASPSWWWRM